MTWKGFLIGFFKYFVSIILASTLGLGALGFLLAGKTGLENGLIWGAALGLLGAMFTVPMVIYSKFWGKKESGVGDPVVPEEDTSSRWPLKKE